MLHCNAVWNKEKLILRVKGLFYVETKYIQINTVEGIFSPSSIRSPRDIDDLLKVMGLKVRVDVTYSFNTWLSARAPKFYKKDKNKNTYTTNKSVNKWQ